MDDVYGLYMYALETWYPLEEEEEEVVEEEEEQEDLLLVEEDHLLVKKEDTMSLEHTYRVHRHHPRSKSKKLKILTFSRN